MEHSRIPNRLKYYRKAHGLFQKDVNSILEIKDVSTILRWEKGISFPGALHLIALCHLYHRGVEQLYPDIWNELGRAITEKEHLLSLNKKMIKNKR
jgi:transcriptional regulator with XRE-family HTH domain